jgi:hypothetical protein
LDGRIPSKPYRRSEQKLHSFPHLKRGSFLGLCNYFRERESEKFTANEAMRQRASQSVSNNYFSGTTLLVGTGKSESSRVDNDYGGPAEDTETNNETGSIRIPTLISFSRFPPTFSYKVFRVVLAGETRHNQWYGEGRTTSKILPAVHKVRSFSTTSGDNF